MKLSNETIDTEKNKCYEKDKRKIKAFVVEARGGFKKERLRMALSLLLSEEDVAKYFGSKEDSSFYSNNLLNKKE